MNKYKSLLVGASAILISIALSSNYTRSAKFVPELSDKIEQRDNLIRLLEVVSLGDSNAVVRLEDVATPQVRDKVSAMCGDTGRRVPEPEIWTLDIEDNKGVLVFESKVRDDLLQVYRYEVEFGQGNNKIVSLASEYLYSQEGWYEN